MTLIIPKNIQNKLQYSSKKNNITIKNFSAYDNLNLEFLSTISKEIFSSNSNKRYSDLISFAFWARRKSLELSKKKYNLQNSFGRGLTFHITPSNVALNFLYSFSFSLLAGNSNIVRLPSKKFKEIDIFLNIYNKLRGTKFDQIYNCNTFVRYKHNDEVNSFFSSVCDTRMIWGGDKTVQNFKEYKTNKYCLDITFPDRFSLSIMNAKSLNKLNDLEIKKLILNFYNDTYLFDQMACNSPHLIVWTNPTRKLIDKFWIKMNEFVKKQYNLDYFMSMEKLTRLQLEKNMNRNIKKISHFDNLITVINLKKLDENYNNKKVGYGFFYEIEKTNLNELFKKLNKDIQTITYFGIKKKYLESIINKNLPRGVDRIVPVGQSSKMNFTWDGYDMINILSRKIEIN